ncbi:hypothetical protein ACQ858_08240 [Variovorax ureilyticus]|uniref:hypothetical protein n=1 Tax=Variovorax ureilyticus TaxID=1836198 RepID=UPI003D67A0CE
MSSTVAASPPVNTASVEQLRQHQIARIPDEADHVVSMFSLRGFELAQRIARAMSTSNAVPAAFRQFNEKKDRDGNITYIENPSALGNCLVAIETAQAVGMSITAVMQNANVIEGRLTWSGQYKIAAINASRRFTPLRFQIINRGMIKATYREKQGWNKEKRGFDFIDRQVEIENLECIAWALPGNMVIPPTIRTLQQAREANLPLIESAPVSMKLAVEEGWYSKPGSKWQTEMKHLMLQYRAGSFFGNIHAPDVVMGMGRTSEEVQDAIVLDVDNDGRVTRVSVEDLNAAPVKAEVVQASQAPDPQTGEVAAPTAAAASAKPEPTEAAFDVEAFAEKLAACKTSDALEALFDTLRSTSANEDQRAVLTDVFNRRQEEIAAAATAASPAPASRRARASSPSME